MDAFSAGRRGKDVRSDCWANFTPRDSGGIDLNITSKVSSMFGESIRTQTFEVLNALKIEHCLLEIEDAGALPFVISARIEAAVRRSLDAQYGKGCIDPMAGWMPPFKQQCRYPTSRDRLRRSRLYLPGNEPKYFLNAGLHKPDAVILDLEDAVSPLEKDAARVIVRNALRTIDFYGAERMVRINQGEMGIVDLEWILPHNVHVILIPKVEDAVQIKEVEYAIHNLQTPGSNSEIRNQNSEIFLMPIIESAKGGINAYSIATASPRIVALAIGLEDYTADIGVERTLEGRESFWLRSQVVNAAKAAGIQAIDTVFSDVGDMEGLKASVRESKSLGFEGRGCIHPRQIPIVHEAFAPTDKELAKAERIVAAFKEAEEKGLGVVSLGSKMIDPPVVKRALKTVEMAKRVRK